MANWLQKIASTALAPQKQNLPAPKAPGQVAPRPPVSQPQQQLSNASVIYGMAASALFVIGLYFLFTGAWFTGFLVFLPGICFLGFALQLMKIK